MCGIAGLVGPLARDPGPIREMTRVQAHRGPDDRDHWHAPELPVAFGHDRLSILDLSEAGRQPMHSADGRFTLVFNGEVYDYLELRDQLDGPWRTGTDTEVLLAAWARWGVGALPKLNGMFAFAVWDAELRTLDLVRDRLGIKPLHWARIGESFAFASEIKGLLAAGLPARPDRDSWATYLVHGVYDHSDATFFEGAASLPAGHRMRVAFTGDGVRVSDPVEWWSPAGVTVEEGLEDAEWEDRFLALLDDSVRLRRRSDVPVGVNLSGGIDSATLMAAVDRQLGDGGRVETFTARFEDPRYDEADFADAVPRTAEWGRNTNLFGESEVWAAAAHLTWHQEAPFGGIATLGYDRLHGLARDRGVTVLLEGQGGDELLAGYRYFETAHHLDLHEAGREAELSAEIEASAVLGGPSPEAARAALDALRAAETSGATGPVRYQDGTSHLRGGTLAPGWAERAGEHPRFDRPFADHLRNAQYRDLRHTKLPRVLRMNDRLSMAWSRELREPYLDHRIVELCFATPAPQRIRRGWGKELLRRVAARAMPAELARTPKRAVVTPQREWLRGSLAPVVRRLLASGRFRERGIVDPAAASAAFEGFVRGEGDNAFFIWQWVSAELWWRRFVEGDDRPLDEALAGEAARTVPGGLPVAGTGAGSTAAPGGPPPAERSPRTPGDPMPEPATD